MTAQYTDVVVNLYIFVFLPYMIYYETVTDYSQIVEEDPGSRQLYREWELPSKKPRQPEGNYQPFTCLLSF